MEEKFQDHSSNFDDSSPAMQHLIKVVRLKLTTQHIFHNKGFIYILKGYNNDIIVVDLHISRSIGGFLWRNWNDIAFK